MVITSTALGEEPVAGEKELVAGEEELVARKSTQHLLSLKALGPRSVGGTTILSAASSFLAMSSILGVVWSLHQVTERESCRDKDE